MQCLDTIVKLAQFLSSVAVCAGIIFAFIQLRATIKNAKINLMKTELDIFAKLSEKEKTFVDKYEELSIKSDIDNKQYNLYLKNREQYFNELNLVCLYIVKDYFTEDHFLREYGRKVLLIYEMLKKENAIEKYVNINEVVKRYRKRIE